MKKIILAVLALVVIFASGCSSDNSQTPSQQTPSQPTSDQQQNTTQSSAALPDTSAFIGEDKAKELALGKAGISGDGIAFERVELDEDGGVWHYEVEFRQGKTEYDADIKADDGTVLSFETDYDD